MNLSCRSDKRIGVCAKSLFNYPSLPLQDDGRPEQYGDLRENSEFRGLRRACSGAI